MHCFVPPEVLCCGACALLDPRTLGSVPCTFKACIRLCWGIASKLPATKHTSRNVYACYTQHAVSRLLQNQHCWVQPATS